MIARPAILLLGPTGAGKTPLGDLLQARGYRGKRCFHFDFGAELRCVAADGRNEEATCSVAEVPEDESGRITPDELATIAEALRNGRLLENEEFVIAGKVLAAFVERSGAAPGDMLVMNGLPRHVSQAADVDRIVEVAAVIYLRCEAEAVYRRIRLNTGGDRTGRSDDSRDDVGARLSVFDERTMPLLDHYRRKGVEIMELAVGVNTGPCELLAQLERCGQNVT